MSTSAEYSDPVIPQQGAALLSGQSSQGWEGAQGDQGEGLGGRVQWPVLRVQCAVRSVKGAVCMVCSRHYEVCGGMCEVCPPSFEQCKV